MNTNSNAYTVIYASVLVIVVAALLAFTALSLKPAQTRNVEIDKKMQILSSINVSSTTKDAEALYDKYIKAAYIINNRGEVVKNDAKAAFNVRLEKEMVKPVEEQALPVYECTTESGELKYILPVRGKGLWGPIWGYVALNKDGSTIYGVNFGHKGETPGLGAEINTPRFCNQFPGKALFKNGEFKSIAVLKAGASVEDQDAVDGISGGTITSKALEAMLFDCISNYKPFLEAKEAQAAAPTATVVEPITEGGIQ